MAEELMYTLVIRDDGTAVIKRVTAETEAFGKAAQAAMSKVSESAKMAGEVLSQMGVKYKEMGLMGEKMRSMLAQKIDIRVGKEAEAELRRLGLIQDEVSKKVKKVGDDSDEAGKRGAQGAKVHKEEATQLNRTLERLQRTAMAFLGMWVLTKVMTIPKDVIQGAMEFNAQIETSRLGIASILMAQGEFTDALGYTTSGYQKLGSAMRMSDELVKELQVDNLKTIATFDQLVKAFQQTLAPALERGFSVKQVREYTVAMVQAAGAMGLNLDMLAEETRSMLRGTITPRNTLIATALGITNDDVRRYQGDSEGLFKYLMGRLDAFRTAGIASQSTWAGVTSNLKDAFKIAAGTGFEDLFKFAKQQGQALIDILIVVDEKTGQLKVNPEIIEDFKRLGYLVQGLYLAFKDCLGIIDSLRTPTNILAELWRTISISANSWRRALTGGGTIGKEEGLTGGIPGVTPGFKAPEFFPDWMKGKSMGQIMIGGIKEFNDYISSTGKYTIKEYMDYYQRQVQAGVKFSMGPKPINEEAAIILMKITAETGKADKALVDYLGGWEELKAIGGNVLSLSNEQLDAAVKTAKEYSEAKKNLQAFFPPGVLEKAYTDLMKTRVAIAGINAEQAPLKIFSQIAEATNQYEIQKDIIIENNGYEIQKLLLSKKLTDEVKSQINGMNALAELQKKQVDWKQQLQSISLTKDIVAQEQKYTEMTGDIYNQIAAMEELERLNIMELEIQKEKTTNLTEQALIEMKIALIRKTGAKEREIAAVTLPITQYKLPLAQAGLGWAEATGNVMKYGEFSRKILDYEIAQIGIKHKDQIDQMTDEGKMVLEMIGYLEEKYKIDKKLRDVEMETYSSDKLANATAQYGQMTGNIELQAQAGAVLLANQLKRLDADEKIDKTQLPILKRYLEQAEALRQINIQYDKAKEVTSWQKELAELRGNYNMSLQKSIELLELERDQLIKNNPQYEELLNSLYKEKIAREEARKNMNVPALMNYGVTDAAYKATQQLADAYSNLLPNSVDIATNSLGTFFDDLREGTMSAGEAFDKMAKSWGESVLKMLQDIALLILKVQLLKALGINTEQIGAGGGANYAGFGMSLVKGIMGLFTPSIPKIELTPGSTGLGPTLYAAEGGIFPAMLAHYPIRAYQGGGIAKSPQIGIFGEAGEEAFIPLKGGRVPVQLRGDRDQKENQITYQISIQTIDTQNMERWLKQNEALFTRQMANNLRRGGELKTAVRGV